MIRIPKVRYLCAIGNNKKKNEPCATQNSFTNLIY